MMKLINESGQAVIYPGTVRVSIGGSLPGSRSRTLGAAAPQEATITLQ